MARLLADCLDPKIPGKITDKYMEDVIFVLHLLLSKRAPKLEIVYRKYEITPRT